MNVVAANCYMFTWHWTRIPPSRCENHFIMCSYCLITGSITNKLRSNQQKVAGWTKRKRRTNSNKSLTHEAQRQTKRTEKQSSSPRSWYIQILSFCFVCVCVCLYIIRRIWSKAKQYKRKLCTNKKKSIIEVQDSHQVSAISNAIHSNIWMRGVKYSKVIFFFASTIERHVWNFDPTSTYILSSIHMLSISIDTSKTHSSREQYIQFSSKLKLLPWLRYPRIEYSSKKIIDPNGTRIGRFRFFFARILTYKECFTGFSFFSLLFFFDLTTQFKCKLLPAMGFVDLFEHENSL